MSFIQSVGGLFAFWYIVHQKFSLYGWSEMHFIFYEIDEHYPFLSCESFIFYWSDYGQNGKCLSHAFGHAGCYSVHSCLFQILCELLEIFHLVVGSVECATCGELFIFFNDLKWCLLSVRRKSYISRNKWDYFGCAEECMVERENILGCEMSDLIVRLCVGCVTGMWYCFPSLRQITSAILSVIFQWKVNAHELVFNLIFFSRRF